MQTDTLVLERIGVLKRLHALWSAELEQLVGVDPDRALQHAEGLDDLKAAIQQLESSLPASVERTVHSLKTGHD